MFKWYRFAKNLHLTGTVMHLVYVFLMALYVLEVYINLNLENARTYQVFLLLGVAYPAAYDTRQFYMAGLTDYLKDPTNYSDLLYIWGSVANAIL